MTGKFIALGDFLSDDDILKCVRLYHHLDRGPFIEAVAKEIIEPQLDEINRKLDQPNDPRFLAYLIEYILTKAGEQ